MKVNPPVFWTSAVVIVLFVLFGVTYTDNMNEAFSDVLSYISSNFGWFYILSMTAFLVFAVFLFFSPFGNIRLGKDHDEPDFSYPTWFAMLFSAGMGIGLVFWGVAEPMFHYLSPPAGPGETAAAAQNAMAITFFHWGLHPWGVYVVLALALAFFSFRHDLPLQIRSTLFPLIGDKIDGPIGHGVEILAVFGTLFGLATSLGLGVMQINAGLDYLGLMDKGTAQQVLLIAVITAAATVSVVTGLDKGIRRLSEMNLVLALILMLFVFVMGPTVFLLDSLVQNIGEYIRQLVPLSFKVRAYDEAGHEWAKSWTLFYWGWWISWAPFVGMFIARVSKGRTIREFVGGVLLVPTLLTFLWMTVFGNTGLYMELFGGGGIASAVNENVDTALFVLLDKLPLAAISSTIAVLIVATFFVTSSDSGSLVIDILTSGGDPNPPVGQKIFWAVTEGVVAGVLLWVGGQKALSALQTASVSTGLPFALVMLFVCYSLYKGLSADRRLRQRVYRAGVAVPQEEPAE
ncbi:BCCT family transporter [Arhodomonas sp. AD133]|uniref:BCCT family transporter n=1 Tax=Arhodomonas sp. AD133 TaxID=3415009 RepID=UPI003EBDF1D4